MFALTALLLFAPATLHDDAVYMEGISLYRELEFEQALFRFEAAAVSAAETAEEKAEIQLWISLCYAGVGREDDALGAMKLALSLHPEAELPEADPPPRIKALFAKAKAAATPAAAPPVEEAPPLPIAEEPIAAADAPSVEEPEAAVGPLVYVGGVGLGIGAAFAVGTVVAGGSTAGAYLYTASLAGDDSAFASDVESAALITNILLGVTAVSAGLTAVSVAAGGAALGAGFGTAE